MKIVDGKFVTGEDFLETRQFLVEKLRNLLMDNRSVLIDAPRRFGKTSIIKEFMFQESETPSSDFSPLYFNLQHVDSIDAFCKNLFSKMLELDKVQKLIRSFSSKGIDFINQIAGLIPKVKIPEFEIELGKIIRDSDFDTWTNNISKLLSGLGGKGGNIVFFLDEFPDMILNLLKTRPENSIQEVNKLLAWLRSIRHESENGSHTFVFTGSVNLIYTLDKIGAEHYINDLEPLRVPVMKRDEAEFLMKSLLPSCGISPAPDSLDYIKSLITGGPPYYGQLIAQWLCDERPESTLETKQTKSIIETMIKSDGTGLSHFRKRLSEFFPATELSRARKSLKVLCHADTMPEESLFDTYFATDCDRGAFDPVLRRLIYEGYVMRDSESDGALRFVSPLLKRWWAFREDRS